MRSEAAHSCHCCVLRDMAKSAGHLSAAISAEVKRGELKRFYVKQIESVNEFSKMSDEESERFIRETDALIRSMEPGIPPAVPHMPRSPISPEEIAVGAQLLTWAQTYLMAEGERIKRPYGPQTVCPFVETSLRNNALSMVFHSDITGEEVDPIAALVNSYINPFTNERDPAPAANSPKALLIIFPRLAAAYYHSLDLVQERLKDTMVENGLMIGQFHPQCKTPAIHNFSWRGVSVAPYPLIAMRHMVVHDILFLRSRRNWFAHYHRRFGGRYERPNGLGARNAHLVPIYNEARDNFLEPGAIGREHTER